MPTNKEVFKNLALLLRFGYAEFSKVSKLYQIQHLLQGLYQLRICILDFGPTKHCTPQHQRGSEEINVHIILDGGAP
jgi:hypothetical protein